MLLQFSTNILVKSGKICSHLHMCLWVSDVSKKNIIRLKKKKKMYIVKKGKVNLHLVNFYTGKSEHGLSILIHDNCVYSLVIILMIFVFFFG